MDIHFIKLHKNSELQSHKEISNNIEHFLCL
jgi:hypothetical protein